jgi:hypothetical protein
MRQPVVSISLLVLALVTAGSAAAIPLAHVQLQSEPGDVVGGGRKFDGVYDPALGDSVSAGVWVPSTAYNQEGVEVYLGGGIIYHGNIDVTISISSGQRGVPLVVGTYLDTQRWGFADPGHPGFSISVQSTVGYTQKGSFTIFDIEFSEDGSRLLKLALEFESFAQGSTSALRGRLDYNVAGITVIPEPSIAILMGIGLVGLAASSRRRD